MTDNDKALELARRLRIAREQSGLSQDAVAKRLNLKRPAVSEIEAGRRKVRANEIEILSQLYSVSMEWLVSGPSDKPDKLELAARGLAALKHDDLDKVLRLLKSLRNPDSRNE